jgi:hypothetical protein
MAAAAVPSRVVVDLDVPPARRWLHIVDRYRAAWKKLIAAMWAQFEEVHASLLALKRTAGLLTLPAALCAHVQDAADQEEDVMEPREFVHKLANNVMAALRDAGHGEYVRAADAAAAATPAHARSR